MSFRAPLVSAPDARHRRVPNLAAFCLACCLAVGATAAAEEPISFGTRPDAGEPTVGKGLPSGLASGVILMTDNSLNALFAVDPLSGDRVQISGGIPGSATNPLIGSGTTFQSPGGVALLPDGKLIVGDGSRDRIFEVDPESGDRTTFSGPLAGSGPALSFPSRLTFDPASGTVYVTDPVLDTVFAIDPDTGDRSIVSSPVVGGGPAFSRPSGAALATPDTLVVCDLDLIALFEVDVNTGERTIISGDPTGLDIGTGPLASSSHLIVVGGNVLMKSRDDDAILSVNRSTGDRTVLSGAGVGTGPALDSPNGGIAFAGPGFIYYGEQGESPFTGIVRVELATGNRTLVTTQNGVGSGASFISPTSIYALPMFSNSIFADGFETGDTGAWSATTP